MRAKIITESVSKMRQDIEKRRRNANDRFASLAAQPDAEPAREHGYGYGNPSRAKINEVLASLFHKADPELAKDEV